MFHVWQKIDATDPNNESVKFVYVPLFTTTDRDHAVSVCSNDDARYVFTSGMGYFAVN